MPHLLLTSAEHFVYSSDISQGKAKIPIQMIGPLDDSSSNFPHFVYENKPNFNFAKDMPKRQFCICNAGEDCSTNQRCFCVNISKVKMAKSERIANVDALDDSGFNSTLFECNTECGCAGRCGNRLIPEGKQKNNFEIVKKPKVGFTCKTLKPIRKGSFVSCLAGEVLSTAPDDLDSNSTPNNPAGFFFQDTTLQLNFFVRTDRLANESRFFNSACCPNLVPVFVHSKTAIMERPTVVFVARHEINAKEELAFYYGDYWLLRTIRDNPKFKCRCNSPFCVWPPDMQSIEEGENSEKSLITRVRKEIAGKDLKIGRERHEKKKQKVQLISRVLANCSAQSSNTLSQDERGDDIED